MEEEISLKEIFLMFWRGRYIVISATIAAVILALIVSLFLITPLYEAEALLDPSFYEISNSNLRLIADKKEITRRLMANEAEEDKILTGKFVLFDYDQGIGVRVTALKPEQAAKEANLISEALLEIAADNRKEILTKELNSELRWIAIIDDAITEMYGEDKKNEVSLELIKDPIYLKLIENKSNSLIRLYEIEWRLNETGYLKELKSPSVFIPASVPLEPLNVRWKLNSAIAGVLGLILSLLFVFLWPGLKNAIYENKAQAIDK